MPKLTGETLVVEVQPDFTGSYHDVSGASRTFEYEESSTEIDVTTRDSTSREYKVTRFTEISAKISGITLEDETPALTYLPRGGEGSIKWYPEGKTAGKPMYTSTYVVTKAGQQYPHDGAVTWSQELRLNSAIDLDDTP